MAFSCVLVSLDLSSTLRCSIFLPFLLLLQFPTRTSLHSWTFKHCLKPCLCFRFYLRRPRTTPPFSFVCPPSAAPHRSPWYTKGLTKESVVISYSSAVLYRSPWYTKVLMERFAAISYSSAFSQLCTQTHLLIRVKSLFRMFVHNSNPCSDHGSSTSYVESLNSSLTDFPVF